MPSLNALGEFKFSFSNIANEKKDVLSKNLPFDDLPLPDTEAAPMDFSSQAPSSGLGGDDIPETDSGGDLDFGAFLNSLPADVNPSNLDEPPSFDDLIQDTNAEPPGLDDLFQDTALPPLDDIPGSDFPTVSEEETLANFDLPPDVSTDTPIDALTDTPEDVSTDIPIDAPLGEDDFSLPDVLPPDLPGEVEQPPTDFGFEDFGDLGSEDLGSEEPGAGDFSPDSPVPEDFGSEDIGPEDTSPEELNNIADIEGEISNVGVGSENLDTSQDGGELPDEILGTDDFFKDFDIPEAPSSEDALSEESAPVSEDTLSEEDAAFSEEPFSLEDVPSPDIADTFDSGDGIDLGGETPEAGGEEAGGDFSLDADFESPLPDTDFSGMDETAQDDSSFESPLPDTDFSGADLDAGFDTPLPDTDFSGFDMGGEESTASENGESADGAGLGGLASDFESDSIEIDSEPEEVLDSSGGSFGGGAAINDDFALPGLEEIFDKTKVQTTMPPAPKKRLFGKRKQAEDEIPEAEESIEEIQLTQEQLDKLLRTLSVYPMNLRIACEEMIAEQVLLPKQLSKLLNLLVNGANVRETAALAEEVLKKPIVIPKSFEKMTGAAFEAEQASFAYIFVHNFLPVLRLFAVIAAFVASVLYLGYKFIYIPVKAESIYKRGYERIPAGEYQRANQLFNEAFVTHQKKKWFYLYAEAFRDQRRYLLAEEKYDELLRHYPRDKKGVLDYARLETYYMLNYDKANRLLQQQLLDYIPNDYDGLLAAGDNFLIWADSDPDRFYDKYEDARFSYARLLETYGWLPPVVERMLTYFIHTDNLKETLYLRVWFENDSKRRKLSTASLAELGGYLLDKQLETPNGVPDPFIESIASVRDMLLQAVREEPTLPEPHYHLARYHNSLGNAYEERLTLENAIRAFDLAQTETVRRRLNRVDTHYRYSNLLVNNREFFPAEEQIVRGIQLYEDFLSRNLIRATPQLGQLYAAKGDLEYFVKSGNMNAALNDYRLAERYGYSPPEIQYRMGAAYYQLENWGNALDYLFRASAELPLNRRLLYALGNVTYQRGDYFAAQGYYNRLLDILENQRIRLPVLLPNDNPEFLEIGERLMMARNNAGVVYEALAEQTGNREYRSRALALYAESARAWDSITRNPQTMIRMRLTDSPGAPGINLGYLNANNALRPSSNYRSEIFVRIDKDVNEPSRWEELAPFGGLGF